VNVLPPSKAKKKVVAAAMGFGPVGWSECGLPHPVPIACVGCGDCDIALLQAIAKLTNGMYVIVGNISELSTFFRRQVGLEAAVLPLPMQTLLFTKQSISYQWYAHGADSLVYPHCRFFSFDLQPNLHQVGFQYTYTIHTHTYTPTQ